MPQGVEIPIRLLISLSPAPCPSKPSKPLSVNSLFINQNALLSVAMQEVYKALADHSPEAIFALDLKSLQLVYANEAFISLTGISVDTAALNALTGLVHPEDLEYLKNAFSSMINGEYLKVDIRLNIGKEQKWIRLKGVTTYLHGSQTALAYATDITAERNNLNTIKKYANKKNSTLNILSHDLRGPLGMANTATQILKQKIVDPRLIELTEKVSSIIGRSIEMINNLVGREFSETTDVELVKQRTNIVKRLKEYLEEAQRSESITKRTFRFSSSGDNIFIELDESKFMQVINNLMTNSLKFTEENGIISLKVDRKEHSVLFTFSDNGIGIPKRYHPTLFAKFTDARRKGLHGEETTGLGLSIVKTIVEWHEGKIWFDSEEGKGTTFYIEMPVK